jgi:hypothetical protein
MNEASRIDLKFRDALHKNDMNTINEMISNGEIRPTERNIWWLNKCGYYNVADLLIDLKEMIYEN